MKKSLKIKKESCACFFFFILCKEFAQKRKTLIGTQSLQFSWRVKFVYKIVLGGGEGGGARCFVSFFTINPFICAIQKIKLSTNLIYLLQYILNSCTSERAIAMVGVLAKTNGLLLGP